VSPNFTAPIRKLPPPEIECPNAISNIYGCLAQCRPLRQSARPRRNAVIGRSGVSWGFFLFFRFFWCGLLGGVGGGFPPRPEAPARPLLNPSVTFQSPTLLKFSRRFLMRYEVLYFHATLMLSFPRPSFFFPFRRFSRN